MNHQFTSGKSYAILGPNGSGKSTLMKVLSGHLSLTKGTIRFQENGTELDREKVYRQVAYAAPYIELIEEFTLEEAIRFHIKMRPLLPGLDIRQFVDRLELGSARRKELRFFSSGMKQRLKLGLSVCTSAPVLLLDEPTTNLDLQAIDWYKQLVSDYGKDRLLVIASNDPSDLELCEEQLNIMDYKARPKGA